ncbi:MAG: hypothetical protein JW994_07780 [Candidatus Omnitrophica bacterium]|nr:hypothetical protein [Candidatus Omnitrophota bacterium]
MDKLGDLIQEIVNCNLTEHRYPNVELKRNWDDDCGKKISALCNKIEFSVSWMVIGIEDNGTLSNFDEKWAIRTEQIISQHLNTKLDPSQACLGVNAYQVNGGWVVVIKLSNPGAVTCWNNKAYKSAGTTISEMKPEEFMEFTIKLPGLADFSRQEGTGLIDDNLRKKFIENLLNARTDLEATEINKSDINQFFDKIKILGTKTSDILFGDFQYRIIFYNKDKSINRQDTKKGLYGLIGDGAMIEIQNWAKTLNNIETDAFPAVALKEGLANAVAHAAYFENNGEIIIEIFFDKIVISNLCLPECGYFANKWFSRSHKTVNGRLVETLRFARVVDELGRGKHLIFTHSIKDGKEPPVVNLEKAGRLNRWRLSIYGGTPDEILIRLYKRIKKIYADEQKALIAYSLILWRRFPVTQIRKFIDDVTIPLFVEVIKDPYGPVFFYEKDDRLILQRWVRILLEEGKDSKIFTSAEEDRLYNLAYDISTKYSKAVITPKELRRYGDMADTKSESVLSSSMLRRWEKEGKVKNIRKGKYKFVEKVPEESSLSKLMELLRDKNIE